jgi:hypothetical protein
MQDYNGFQVSRSEPKKVLRTVKKTLVVDSSDRDTTKYYTNGDFVLYLPRVYENVVSIRLVAAEFPPLVVSGSSPGACTHSYVNGPNYSKQFTVGASGPTGPTGPYTGPLGGSDINGFSLLDTPLGGGATNYTTSATGPTGASGQGLLVPAQYKFPYYFLIDLEGLNKVDETTFGGQKSTYADSFFAKIPAVATANQNGSVAGTFFIEYNDHSAQENIARYTPAIGKVDRLHVRTRLHYQQDRNGFIYWTTNGSVATSTNVQGADFSLTLEIEMLDNVFDDFSSMETHLRDRS